MTTTINASTSSGLVATSDNSGTIDLQSNGTTKATVNSSGFYAPGCIVQVISVNRSGEASTTSTSFVDAPDLTLSITPKSANSKIYITYTGSAGNDGTQESYLTLVRNSTNLGNGTAGLMRIWYNGSSSYHFGGYSMSYLDSPATTSATTYKVQYRTNSGIVYVSAGNSTDTLTVMEVAA